MKKTILFDLQLSSFDTNGALVHKSDSNDIFNRSLINVIKDEYLVVTLLPYIDRMWPSITIPVKYGRDYYDSRLFYDWTTVEQALCEYRPDVIWTNNPVWVLFYLASLRKLKMDIPIVTYNHYIDLPGAVKNETKYSLAFPQLDGMHKANLVLVNSNWGKQIILNGSKFLLHQPIDEQKIIPFPPSIISTSLLNRDEGYIVYNHRLSPTPYYKLGLDKFSLLLTRINCPVIFTNPSKKDEIKFNFLHSYQYFDNHFEYLTMLSKARCSVCSIFDLGAQWSMSIVDSIACNVPALIPRIPGYTEIIPVSYPYFYTDVNEGKDKLDVLSRERQNIELYKEYVFNYYGINETKKRFREVMGKIL